MSAPGRRLDLINEVIGELPGEKLAMLEDNFADFVREIRYRFPALGLRGSLEIATDIKEELGFPVWRRQ